MSKVTIVLRDTADGTVNVAIDFNPPARKGAALSAAQSAAFEMLDALQDHMQEAQVQGERIAPAKRKRRSVP